MDLLNNHNIFFKVFITLHNSMNKMCSALFKCENNLKNWLRRIMHSFEVQSNESACRKSGRLGLDQVRSQKFIRFTSMDGGRITELGVPYLYCYPKNYYSVYIRPFLVIALLEGISVPVIQ